MEEVTTPTEDIATVSTEPDNAGEPALMEETAPTEEPITESPALTEKPVPAEGQPDNSSKSSRDFTPEERATIIAMAKELGTAKVAREFGIRARLISYWLHQEKKKASKQSKQNTAKVHMKGKDSKRTFVKEAAQPEHMEDSPTVPVATNMSAEPVKTDKLARPSGRKAEKTVSAKVPEKSEGNRALTDGQMLMIENAILKERISALNAEIEKLRAALTSLM